MNSEIPRSARDDNQASGVVRRDLIRFERSIYFRDGTGNRHDLYGIRGLPAPFNLSPALLRFNVLSLRERTELAGAMIEMMRLGRSGRDQLDNLPFRQWLDDHQQSPELVRKMYDTILIGALNEETRLASARYAIQVFQDSLLANEAGYPIGIPDATLAELYRSLPCRDVRLSTRVTQIVFDGSRAVGVKLQSGEVLTADAIVLATNHHAVQRWIPDELQRRDDRFAGLSKLESVPILGAHLWFDRPVIHESHAALLTGPLQWVFRKDATGTSVHGVISAARHWVDVPKDQMLKRFEQQLRDALPEARSATLVRGVVVIEKRATFAPLPGVDRLRPAQAPPAGGIENLYLAGDYTRTGWPATMEGAVRSGYLAADAVGRSLISGGSISGAAKSKSFLVNDLSVQWPARLLGLAK